MWPLSNFFTSLVLSFLTTKVNGLGLTTSEFPFSCNILGLWHGGRPSREETRDKLVFVSPSHHRQRCNSTSLTLQTVTRTAGRKANWEGVRQKTAPSPVAPLPTWKAPQRGQPKESKSPAAFWGPLAISAKSMRAATLSAWKSPKRQELRKGLLHLSKTCDVPFIAFPPVIITQSSILGNVNRWLTGRFWRKLGARAGCVHSIDIFCFPPSFTSSIMAADPSDEDFS